MDRRYLPHGNHDSNDKCPKRRNIFDEDIPVSSILGEPLTSIRSGGDESDNRLDKADKSTNLKPQVRFKKIRSTDLLSSESVITSDNAPLDLPVIGKGTDGRRLELQANFFKLTFKNTSFYQYVLKATFPVNKSTDLSDTESRIEKFMKQAGSVVFKNFYEQNINIFNGGQYIFDGQHILFTTRPLTKTDHDHELRFDYEGRKRSVVVKLQAVGVLHSDRVNDFFSSNGFGEMDPCLVTLFDILFNKIFDKEFAAYQNKHYNLKDSTQSRNGTVDYVRGFINSVRPVENSLALNIHLTTGVAISRRLRSLADLVQNLLNIRCPITQYRFQDRDFSQVNKIIKGLKVFTEYGNIKRVYTVAGIDPAKPSSIKFDHIPDRSQPDKIVRITVAEYHYKTYGHRVVDLPMVRVAGRKNIWLPLEFCLMPEGQFLNKSKINSQLQAEQLRVATQPADQYMRQVKSLVNKATRIDPKLLSAFGVSLEPHSMPLTGRQLQTPALSGDERSRDKFHKTPGDKATFAIFILDVRASDNVIEQFKNGIRNAASSFRNLTFAICKVLDVQDADHIRLIFKNAYKNDIKLIFVGIPERHPYFPDTSIIYNLVKHYGDQMFGVVTQCFNLSKMSPQNRGLRGYFDNIILKVNGKMDGQNTVVREDCLDRTLPSHMKRRSVMVLGLDVNHSVSAEDSSIAAAVGTFDSTFNRFISSVRMQPRRREEIIVHLEEMITELLEQFHSRNKSYPAHLLIYRDGVSEGQFVPVLQTELQQIKRAICNVVGQPVKVTFMVVQKTHNGRFMLTNPVTGGRQPIYNVPSGTVVDDQVVERGYPTFYLNSHFSPLGISKPAKYVLLLDENNFNSNQLQTLTFYLCFSCVRTRKPISIPVATYYADLLAYRAKGWINARIYLDRDIHRGELNIDPALVAPNDAVKKKLYFA